MKKSLFTIFVFSFFGASAQNYFIRYITKTNSGFDTTWGKSGVWDTNYIRRNGSIIPMGKSISREYLDQTNINNSSTFVSILSFGASTGNADNRAAIIAAREYIYSNPVTQLTMYIPKGTYQVSDSIHFNKNIKIVGDGVIGYPLSIFSFPEGKNGFVFSFANGQNGFGADVENIAILGQLTPGYNTTNAHAFTIRTKVKFTNVSVSQFDGNGFHVSACATQPSGDNNNYGNADQSVFLNCSATYCTNGFFSEGCDAQVMKIRDCNFSQNRRWGYFGNAFVGDKLDNVHFAFDGVAVPGAKSVVTYNSKYYVAKSGYDGYFGDATDSNLNKQPDTNPNYWMEVTPPMVESGAWSSSTRYYSGGPAIVKTVNGWTTFHHCYTEAFEPPVVLNTRSRWEYGTPGAGVIGGIVKNTLYGEEHTYNGGHGIEKYLMVGTTTYDPSTVLKSYNDYSKTSSRVVFKGEGTTGDIYLDLKNSTGKSARINYSSNDLRIYTKDDSLGLTINDVGVTAKKFFGDGSGLTGVTGGSGLGYTLSVQALTGSPTDAQTVYFGQLPKAPTTTANISKVYIRKSGTIKIAQIYAYAGTAGTGEAWSLYIRLNNTTDNLIATVSSATSERIFTNSSLSIAVVAGDYIEIKSVNPTWATNPLTLIYGGYIYIE